MLDDGVETRGYPGFCFVGEPQVPVQHTESADSLGHGQGYDLDPVPGLAPSMSAGTGR